MGTMLQVYFDLARWRKVARLKYPDGLPKPYSNDPTQWLFDGHARGSADPNVLDANDNPTRPGLAEHPLQVTVAQTPRLSLASADWLVLHGLPRGDRTRRNRRF